VFIDYFLIWKVKGWLARQDTAFEFGFKAARIQAAVTGHAARGGVEDLREEFEVKQVPEASQRIQVTNPDSITLAIALSLLLILQAAVRGSSNRRHISSLKHKIKSGAAESLQGAIRCHVVT